jgi:hypothetical protein
VKTESKGNKRIRLDHRRLTSAFGSAAPERAVRERAMLERT